MKTFKEFQESVTDLTKKQKKDKFAPGERVVMKGKFGKRLKKAELIGQHRKGKIIKVEPFPKGDVTLTVDFGRMGEAPWKVLGSKVKVVK